MRKFLSLVIVLLLVVAFTATSAFAESPLTKITDIIANPKAFEGKTVNVSGFFSIWKNAPGAPPVSRSDWVLCDAQKHGIYCTGSLPSNDETGELETFWKPLNIVGIVEIAEGKPYIRVITLKAEAPKVEKMVSVRQIILNQEEIEGEYVGLMGVLGKGYGLKGDRMYLIADPTGAIRIGRTSKVYPKGTILHIKGIVTTDEYGIPMIDQVDIISAKVD